jgi:hypothetical protein
MLEASITIAEVVFVLLITAIVIGAQTSQSRFCEGEESRPEGRYKHEQSSTSCSGRYSRPGANS